MYHTDSFAIYLLSRMLCIVQEWFFDNREPRRNPAFGNDFWYQHATVGYFDGWFSHAHWNERFLKEDMCPDWL